MTQRELKGSHILMRIFIGESDKADGKPLYLVIIEKARKLGLAGCTVVKGIAGFGAGSVIHMDAPFRLSGDLPIILEFVDTYDHVHKLLAEIKPLLQGALVTEEKVTVHHYKHSTKKS